ncbi:hypothetical protein LOC68_27250 [Blastopirellula sp. JC732]|uniref:Uncharacterized protein n=1 Tax=Blastopirellula sediminis TaxID=2894196 RepID=A0A9X1MRM3_9BACT|nr:hypothetical protein [Blastopirellula sediminis]MCC9604593.1 hypothetical protein [Blastopirellula sediminis]MCC9632108.1 hypothetical protein [Blastopirellula sediminis]
MKLPLGNNIVEEINARQDYVLEELDNLNRRLEELLATLVVRPEPELIPVPVPVQEDQRRAA